RLTPAVFDQQLDDMIAATGSGTYRAEVGSDVGSMARRRLKKLAREFVRPGVQVDDMHEALLTARRQRSEWLRLAKHDGTPTVPSGLVDVSDKFDRLKAA